MKLLVIPDIHTKYEKADRIVQQFNKTHKLIFTGDYFDQFGDTPELNGLVANWLKSTMDKYPDWVYLYGNHDIQYHPHITQFCSGFSSGKKDAINSEMSIDDWKRLKFFHFENGYWFSHAGITEFWFKHPITNSITVNSVQKEIDDAHVQMILGQNENAIWSASYRRGGKFPTGGILWEDFRDIKLIQDMHQVVGHTPVHRITTIVDNTINSSVTNVDNSYSGIYMTELLEIDEAGIKTKIDTFHI